MPSRIRTPSAPSPSNRTTDVDAPGPTPTPSPPASVVAPDAVVPTPTDFTSMLGILSPAIPASVLARARGTDPFDLVPGRYPDAVPLGTVLNGIGKSPEGRALIQKLIADVVAKTGVEVPQQLVDQVLADPSKFTHLLALDPKQLSRGIDALNLAYKNGRLPPGEERQRLLPERFDLAELGALQLERETPHPKELGPGLYQGSLPSTATDAQVKTNRVVAEMFDRLAANAGDPTSERFSATYAGRTYTKLESFLEALKADGHELSVTMEQRVANFANLKTMVPGSNPPEFLDVPAPLMVRTGIQDANGQEALVPAVHSELVIRIRKGPETRGPGIDADVKWYQGTGGTGFFPCNTAAEPAWCGRVQSNKFEGADALRAVRLAGALGDVINESANGLGLWNGGYGATGVCNDSIAIIQHAMTGTTTVYPLLMRDETLLGELQQRLTDRSRVGDADYAALRESIRAVPSDAESNPTSRERALSSLPWAPGQEPFKSTELARKILGG